MDQELEKKLKEILDGMSIEDKLQLAAMITRGLDKKTGQKGEETEHMPFYQELTDYLS